MNEIKAQDELIENENENEEQVEEEQEEAPVRRFKVKTRKAKEVSPDGKAVKASSLDSLAIIFDNEQFVIFDEVADGGDPIVFKIKTGDPSLLLLETSSPIYLQYAQNVAADENYINSLTNEQTMELLRSELQHKYEVLIKRVIDPILSLDGSDGFPVSQLPSEIINDLYSVIMGVDIENDEETEQQLLSA